MYFVFVKHGRHRWLADAKGHRFIEDANARMGELEALGLYEKIVVRYVILMDEPAKPNVRVRKKETQLEGV